MPKYLTTLIRTVLLAAALALAVPAANAGPINTHRPVTARTMAHTTDETPPADHDRVGLDGVLIIAGVVGAVVVFAWVCSRVGDNRRPTMMM